MLMNEKSIWACLLLAGVVALSGCTSLLQGKQYVSPQAGERSATVRLQDESGAELQVMTFNESGCYAGYTSLSEQDGFIEGTVAAGKELVLTYVQNVAGGVCQIPFSFTPEDGATYTLQPGFWSEPKAGALAIFTRDQDYCGVGVVKKVGTQESAEPIQKLRIKVGFACLRYIK